MQELNNNFFNERIISVTQIKIATRLCLLDCVLDHEIIPVKLVTTTQHTCICKTHTENNEERRKGGERKNHKSQLHKKKQKDREKKGDTMIL